MNIQEQLIERGYKKYVSKSNAVFKMTDTLFQKKITDVVFDFICSLLCFIIS